MNWIVDKYKGSWGIYDNTSRCWVMFGKEKDMKNKVKELNNEESKRVQKSNDNRY